jgi:hypothetical protein
MPRTLLVRIPPIAFSKWKIAGNKASRMFAESAFRAATNLIGQFLYPLLQQIHLRPLPFSRIPSVNAVPLTTLNSSSGQTNDKVSEL